MVHRHLLAIASLLAAAAVPAEASGVSEIALVSGGGSISLPAMLQCVPYARTVSGIQIRGDAWTWWGQAAGKYARGDRPKLGAVMAFKPHGKMELGHVAAISGIIDSRTVLLRHANWSLINGARGQIENDVRAVDVSPANDWSEVRVWFAPLQGLGSTAWPVHGFIYNESPEKYGKTARRSQAAERLSEPFADDPIGAIIAEYLR